jgi:hypothetical protein
VAASLIAAALFGSAAYLVIAGRTRGALVPVVGAVATIVVSYFVVGATGLLLYWVPACAN